MNKIDKEELKRLKSRTKGVFITILFLLIFLAVITLVKK